MQQPQRRTMGMCCVLCALLIPQGLLGVGVYRNSLGQNLGLRQEEPKSACFSDFSERQACTQTLTNHSKCGSRKCTPRKVCPSGSTLFHQEQPYHCADFIFKLARAPATVFFTLIPEPCWYELCNQSKCKQTEAGLQTGNSSSVGDQRHVAFFNNVV